jgi:hypothetical protein
MNPILSAMSRYLGFPRHGRGPTTRSGSQPRRKARRSLLSLESLEDRCLLSVAVSIGDASANEGSSTLKFVGVHGVNSQASSDQVTAAE